MHPAHGDEAAILPTTMRLEELMPGEAADSAVEVRSLAYDSRAVTPGALFFCVPGFRSDGHDFAPEAIRRGGVALVVERPLGLGLPEIRVPSVRAAMGPVASRFYGNPSGQLELVGVTGTNGKTTTAFLVRGLIEACGRSCGLLGTVTTVIGGVERPAVRTTPEAIDLQADLRAMLDRGDRACALEVSSHALELDRASGLRFAAAIFTNLTQDHLDFHPTMEAYFEAKRRLFLGPEPPGRSIINADDAYGRRLLAELPAALSFGLQNEAADYRASDLRAGPQGSRFTLHTPSGRREVDLGLLGRFNVANALAALAAVDALGGDLDTLVQALAGAPSAPGRLEAVEEGQAFTLLVDYAHTPDSLENVLQAARELLRAGTTEQRRLLCVFGAGGDRDRGKRPLMGAVAARLADTAIVTSDNPRSESPESIIEQILAGIPAERLPAVEVLADRRRAIERAVELARPEDLVLIAGKGHEHGQEFAGGRKLPFDDVRVAREALRARLQANGTALRSRTRGRA
jgi:UDP-N-acetylmuramoyl-L-alanyl-D-glutamate--2,6-diaminopimelate ligase